MAAAALLPGAGLCLGRAEEDRGSAKPCGCRDLLVVGRAVSPAAPCSVFTHQVWFPQFQLDSRRGWRRKKQTMSMSISECIRWEFHSWLCPGTRYLHPTPPTGEHAGSPGTMGGVQQRCLAQPCGSTSAEGEPTGPPESMMAREVGSREGHRASLGLARRKRMILVGSEAASSRACCRESAIEQRKLQ